MANRYYVEGEGRAAGVRDLFGTIARRYDLINDLQSLGLHRLWKRRLVRLADVKEGETALDVCCGTGDLAFALASAGAEVVGIDFSAAMLDAARRRARAANPTFQEGDALRLPHGDGRFDLVTIGYGLRNLRSIEAGLAEMARVTRPRGRLLVLDFARPKWTLWRWIYFLHLRTVVPCLGRMFCGASETHAYILKSLRAYPAPEEIGRRMAAAGWEDVRWWNLLGGAMTIHRGIRVTPDASGVDRPVPS